MRRLILLLLIVPLTLALSGAVSAQSIAPSAPMKIAMKHMGDLARAEATVGMRCFTMVARTGTYGQSVHGVFLCFPNSET